MKRLLDERPVCEAQLAGCAGRSVDIHEILSRGRGGSILDEANLLAVCRACHDRIGGSPGTAHGLGFLRHNWEGPPETA